LIRQPDSVLRPLRDPQFRALDLLRGLACDGLDAASKAWTGKIPANRLRPGRLPLLSRADQVTPGSAWLTMPAISAVAVR